jgi:hypothetical protein
VVILYENFTLDQKTDYVLRVDRRHEEHVIIGNRQDYGKIIMKTLTLILLCLLLFVACGDINETTMPTNLENPMLSSDIEEWQNQHIFLLSSVTFTAPDGCYMVIKSPDGNIDTGTFLMYDTSLVGIYAIILISGDDVVPDNGMGIRINGSICQDVIVPDVGLCWVYEQYQCNIVWRQLTTTTGTRKI